MFRNIKNQGFSLIEIILAVAVFSLSVMTLIGGLIYGQESALRGSHRERAAMLAEEGIEAVENIGRDDFSNLADGTYGLSIVSNVYSLSGTPDIIDIYERTITITTVDGNTKEISTNVSWGQDLIDEGEVELVTYITDWR